MPTGRPRVPFWISWDLLQSASLVSRQVFRIELENHPRSAVLSEAPDEGGPCHEHIL